MVYRHGVYIQENATSIVPPVESDSGVQVVVGTAPVNLALDPYGSTNKPILAYSWKEAVEKLGYSDDWDSFTLSESMDASFKRIGVAPVVFINVLNPTEHKTSGSKTITVLEGEAALYETGVLLDRVEVKDSEGASTYEEGTDYYLAFNKEGYPVVSVVEGGSIVSGEIQVDFEKIDPSLITSDDIIGGYDVLTGESTGLELVGEVYPRLGIVPGMILAPGYSQKPEVAIVIDVKSELINGSFNCMNVLDLDNETVRQYADVPEWKTQNAYTSKRSIALWPKVKIGDKSYWYSSVMAPLIAYTDAQNDNVPYVSPSNKRLPITATVLSDGTEVYLDQVQANFLNGNGVVTAININGWRAWGNNTAVYPATTDIKDRFIPIRRVFDWWGNTFILTYFQKVDDPANYRLIESIVDSENIRSNGLQARGQIAGARIEFRREDNPVTDILGGKIQFIQRIAAFPPAEQIVNVLEFDPTMLENALYGGGQ